MSERVADVLVIQFPLITEKATELQQVARQYVFAVRPDANKNDVRRAVEELFKVRVRSVRIVNLLRKKKRGRRASGQRYRVWKKAYVSLAGDHRIELFDLA